MTQILISIYIDMVNFSDLKNFLNNQDYKLIIVADGEPYVSKMSKEGVMDSMPAGGVAMMLDPIARATSPTYIARAKSPEEKKVLDKNNKMLVGNADGNYILKRLFFSDAELENYYFGFSNQTLWPLCHVAFEAPLINKAWYEGYKAVNKQYAKAIQQEIKGKTFVWVHDYQLVLVPQLLEKSKDTVIGMFWHIPWPTWEVFRVLPYKKELLNSLLSCDFLAFHRGYQARNFLDAVDQELEVRIDRETQKVYYNNHVTTVKSLPLGIDIDVVRSLVHVEEEETPLGKTIREMFGIESAKEDPLDWYFKKYKVMFGVDRLDYTKGIPQRIEAIDCFFEKYPEYIGKAVYLGIISPSREAIPSYKRVKKRVKELAIAVNAKYATKDWKPIHLIHEHFNREDVLNFYRRADVCLVTPLDDGMNLVSKEFVIASSMSSDPGMLVLSQFAGSATDLASSLIVNPYDIDEMADAMKQGLEMDKAEKIARIKKMAGMLEENNVYEWGYNFLREALLSVR